MHVKGAMNAEKISIFMSRIFLRVDLIKLVLGLNWNCIGPYKLVVMGSMPHISLGQTIS